MVRPALDVLDAVAPQLRLELGRAAPRGVLPPLVREDLARRAVGGNTACERLQHQRAPLVMRHSQAHQVARVIVEERGDVDPLMAAQQEREQVRLPQLVGLGPLEARHTRLGPRLGPGCGWRRDPFLAQHPAHRGRRGAEPEEAPHHVADPSAACLRLCRLHRDDRRPLRRAATLVAARRADRAWPQRGLAAIAIPPRPLEDRRVADSELLGDLLCRQVLIDHRACDCQSHVHRPRLSAPVLTLVR